MSATVDTEDTCAFFSGTGRCHRFPPAPHVQLIAYGIGWTSAQHPKVEAADWCGEHQPREDAA